jgi:CRP-like cAMP-binding protein
MEVVPTNTQERVYAVVVIIIAMVLFSSFISAITEAMAHLRRVNNSKDVKSADLRRYFGDHKVSLALATRIWRYLEQSVKARQLRKMWHEVELLNELPKSLQKELQREVYSVTLTRHPFFHNFNEESPNGMMALCHHSIEEVSLIEGQDLFQAGEMARGMYFVVEGSLLYCRQDMSSHLRRSTDSGALASEQSAALESTLSAVVVQPEEWVCEAPLFVEWFHVGSMVARRVSLMLLMDVESVHKVLSQYHDTLRECCRYADLFMEWLFESPLNVSDVLMNFDKQLDMAHRAFSHEELQLFRMSSARMRAGKTSESLMSVCP